MKERRGGSILNISSIAGLNYFPGLMAYGMAKAALEHLTVSAAYQLRPFDIAVNTFRIDVPVASEGFVFNLPDVDHSDWEPSEVAAEGHRVDARAAAELHRPQRRHGAPARRRRGSWRHVPSGPTCSRAASSPTRTSKGLRSEPASLRALYRPEVTPVRRRIS